jgi:hypothetical protein
VKRLLTALSALLIAFSALPAIGADAGTLARSAAAATPPAPSVATATDAALDKLDPRLRDLASAAPGAGADVAGQIVMIDVIARKGAGAAIAKLFEKSFVRSLPKRPIYDADLKLTADAPELNVEFVSGRLRADRLLKVASFPQVATVLKMGAEPPTPPEPRTDAQPDLASVRQRVRDMRDGKLTADQPVAAESVEPNGWFEKTYVQWQKAWAAGYTGAGVNIAVLDSGVDFAHPDLNGLQARVIDPASPYFYQGDELSDDYGASASQGIGLPIASDATSIFDYVTDNRNDVGNWSFYIDTSHKYVKSSFSPYIYVDGARYRLPDAVIGSEVRVGFSSDNSLRAAWTDEDAEELANIPILLANTGKVDLDRNGSFDDFDTVYTDLDNDGDFSNDKPAFLGDETMWWDGDSDGLADLSGGMMYFIADGVNPVPALDYLYGGLVPDDVITPAKGDLLVLMVDDPSEPGGAGHGTRCASAVVSKAVVNGGAPAIKPPYLGPGDGMVQAASKDTRIIAMGNFYAGGSNVDWYFFSLFSYNGEADGPTARLDDPQVVSQSFGNSIYENAGFDFFSRLIGVFNRFYNPYILYTTSSGNGGPGNANTSSPDMPTGMTIGASTQSADPIGFDPFVALDQIVWGDIQPFSNKGPDARGTSGVEMAGNGAWGAGDVPLNERGSGNDAWEIWGGTSRANPAVVGSMANAYQAYRERTGRWPDYQTMKSIAMSTATYNYHNPLATGSGIGNAARMALSAGGVRGLYTTPSLWNVGEYRGADKQNTAFVNILQPGQSSTKTFTVSNASGTAENLTLRDAMMQEIGAPVSGQFTTINQSGETSVFGKPDYLVQVAPNAIPADADLMVVRSTHSFESFDADNDAGFDSRWRLLVYDWTDLDDDGKLWNDANSNGYVEGGDANGDAVIDPSESAELDVGEYNRYSYSYATGTSQEIRVARPAERSHDGIFLGWEHRSKSAKVPTTTMRYEVRFYKLLDWDLLSLSQSTLNVPAASGATTPGTATFNATFTSAASTPKGYYEGYIFADDPGTGAYVRVAHLAPDAPNVDVYVDATQALTNVPYQAISAYLPVTPGEHRFRVTPTGQPLASAVIDVTAPIADGTQYTIAAVGTLEEEDQAEFGGVIFEDDNFEPRGATSKLRVVHTAANAPNVDVYAGDASATNTAPGKKIIAGLRFGRASEYLFVPSGSYEVRVYPAGANPASIAPVFSTTATLTAGDTFNVFAAGDAAESASLTLVTKVDTQQLAFASHTTAIPVTVNIAGNVTGVNPESLTVLGGNTTRANTVYDNGFVHGSFNWTGSNSDDNRRLFVDTQDSAANAYLLTQTTWDDRKPTDIDTLILGPTEDPCEAWFGTCSASLEAAYNAVFGPYVLTTVGSTGRNGSKPVWRYGTGTGGSEDWTAAKITPGLHQVFNDNVLFSGDKPNVAFKTTVGVAQISPATLSATSLPAELNVSFSTNIDLPNGLRGLGFGMSRPIASTIVWTPDDAVGGVYPPKTYDFTVANGGRLNVRTSSPDISDVDIVLYRDANNDGVFSSSEQVGSSGGGTADEEIAIKLPANGRYRVVITNFSQTAGSVNLEIDNIQGNDVVITDLPSGPVPAGTTVNFKVRINRVTGSGTGTFKGIAFVGPAAAPTAIEIPITFTGPASGFQMFLPITQR